MKTFKNLALLFFLIIGTFSIHAQSIQIKDTKMNANGSYVDAFSSFIPEANKKMTEKAVSSWMKDNRNKVKLPKRDSKGKYLELNSVSPNPVFVEYDIVERVDGIELIMAFSDAESNYYSAQINPDKAVNINQMMYDLSLNVRKKVSLNQVEAAEDRWKDSKDLLKKKEKEQAKLESEIKSMKKKIEDNEKEIQNLIKEQGTLKEKIKNDYDDLNRLKDKASKVD
ncbi:MAG TPA: hypothetical protein PKH65_04270 [Bacteroidia bacterium]|nr:hypothetical protein [Bacteroidia bacterium]HNT79874.1 hypothetical protein [Bacteroidia bacterium]